MEETEKNRHEVAWEAYLLQEGYPRERYNMYVQYYIYTDCNKNEHLCIGVDVEHMLDYIVGEWVQWYRDMGYCMPWDHTFPHERAWFHKMGYYNISPDLEIQILTWCEKVAEPLS